MYTCATCNGDGCGKALGAALPANCPMRDADNIRNLTNLYHSDKMMELYKTGTAVEALGYGRWPRLRETVEFCLRMKYRKVGIAFCKGLHREAKGAAEVVRAFGLDAVSVVCKAGGIAKEQMGIAPEHKLNPDEYEPMCNPIAQAQLLNQQYCEFNIVIGLCVGHDAIFCKYSQAPVTTLIVKDRVLAHNPAGAIYCRHTYFEEVLRPDRP